MKRYSLSHVADHVLLRNLSSLVAQDRATTADLLAHIAEVDARRLFRGCESMHAYCERKLGLSIDAAARRIQAARLARRHPEIFAAVADGRLSLTAVCLLSPYIEHAEPAELLAAAAHRTKEELLVLLAARFPKPDVPTSLLPIGPPRAQAPSAPAPGALVSPGAAQAVPVSPQPPAPASGTGEGCPAGPPVGGLECQHALAHAGPPSPQRVSVPMVQILPRAQLVPLSPGHRKFTGTFDEETVELLHKAQALLSHSLPSGDYVQVLKRVLQDWVQAAERRRFGLTDKPRERRSAANGRYIPAGVKRAVFKRDGGRCTFADDDNRRCGTRKLLQLDHVTPVAKGGRTTVGNLRLRCARHNQLEAERAFGAGFMERKREQAQGRSVASNPPTDDRSAPGRAQSGGA